MGSFRDFFGFDMPGRGLAFLWTMGIAFLVAISIHDLCPIVTSYLDVDENVNVRIEKNDSRMIKPPGLYFCLPWSGDQFVTQILEYERQKRSGNSDASCPICDGLKQNSWDVWAHLDFSNVTKNQTFADELPGNSEFEIAKSEIFLSFLHKIFSNLTEMENVLWPENSDWHQPIVETILFLFSYINGNDACFQYKVPFYNATNPIDAFIAQRSNAEIDYLQALLVKYQSSARLISLFDFASSVFIQEETLTASFAVTPMGKNAGTSTCTSTFCFRSRRNFTWGLYFQIRPDFFNYSVKWGPVSVSAGDPFDFSKAWTPIFESREKNSLGQPEEAVRLSYSIQANVKEERPGKSCYKQESRSDCLRECRTRKIMAICSCLPFTSKTFAFFDNLTAANLPYCNFEFYRICLDRFTSEDEECAKTCTVACNYTFYQWQSTRIPRMSNNDAQTKTYAFFDDLTAANLPYCNNEIYNACFDRFMFEVEDCAEECTVACEYTFYQWQTTPVPFATDGELVMEIFLSIAPYLEFTLAVKDKKENLISQIGGIFNFYLGLSGLSIFAFLIFLIECYCSWRQRKATGGNGGEEEGHGSGPTWHMIKLATLVGAAANQRQRSDTDLEKKVDSVEKVVSDLLAEMGKLKEQLQEKAII